MKEGQNFHMKLHLSVTILYDRYLQRPTESLALQLQDSTSFNRWRATSCRLHGNRSNLLFLNSQTLGWLALNSIVAYKNLFLKNLFHARFPPYFRADWTFIELVNNFLTFLLYLFFQRLVLYTSHKECFSFVLVEDKISVNIPSQQI